ncbi:hypothetical protein [Ruegeria halocynthiae]|uniref:hypothetical protein n=1 Tax=Ruegeria halocynthiae TaxID=985054 RepID=UPI0005645A42|nr:hypothetical protein [Ruegeria halocynthiae]
MRKIKAIAYGLGNLGRGLIRPALEKGVEFVGAIDINPDLIGRDLGAVAGLQRDLGIAISGDAAQVLAETSADVVLMNLSSGARQIHPQVRDCLRAGINVITSSNDLVYPWTHAPEISALIDTQARKHDVSVVSSGATDALVVNMLSTLAGACHQLKTIEVGARVSLNEVSAKELLSFGVGCAPETVSQMLSGFGEAPLLRTALESVARDLGLTPTRFENIFDPVVAKRDMYVPKHDLHVKAGTAKGLESRVFIETQEGISLSGTVRHELFPKGKHEAGGLAVNLKGQPDISVVLDDLEVRDMARFQIINRIPDVISAAPGLISTEQLCRPKYRARGLGSYLSEISAGKGICEIMH